MRYNDVESICGGMGLGYARSVQTLPSHRFSASRTVAGEYQMREGQLLGIKRSVG